MLVLKCSPFLDHPSHHSHKLINKLIKRSNKYFCLGCFYRTFLDTSSHTRTLQVMEDLHFVILWKEHFKQSPYDEIIFTVSLLNHSSLGSRPIIISLINIVPQSLWEGIATADPWWKDVPLSFSGSRRGDDPGSLAHPECISHLLYLMLTHRRSSCTAQETSLLLMSPHHQNCLLLHFL